MRRKAAAKKGGGADGTAKVVFTLRERTTLKSAKLTPAGKGLGKAGAKRLGRMLKRAIQHQEEPSGKKKGSLPNTPIRLLKHQIETKAKNAPRTNSSKLTSSQASELILSLVAQCKHRAGISMAEVKQTLAAQGYDVTKNNRQVNMVTKRMVNNRTLVETKKNASFRLNKITETRQIKKNPVTNKQKPELKKSYPASKPSKAAQKSQRRNKKTPKPRGKLQKPKGKTNKAAAVKKQPVKTPKPTAKSQKQRRQAKRSEMPHRKNLRTTKNRDARTRKPPKKAKTILRRQVKRGKHPIKSRQQLPKTSSTFKSRNRQTTRKKNYR